MELEKLDGLEKFGDVITNKQSDKGFMAEVRLESEANLPKISDYIISKGNISMDSFSYEEGVVSVRYHFREEGKNKDRGSSGCGLDTLPYFRG